MAKRLSENGQLGNAGDKRTIRGNDLESVTVQAGNEITIYSNQVPADKFYFHGAGDARRNSGRSAFSYADITAADGTDIDGELVAVITDSEQRHVQAEYVVDDLENLREAQNDDRTDRPMQPVVAPAAREDQHLELRIRATEDSSGKEVDPAASSVKLYFTDLPR